MGETFLINGVEYEEQENLTLLDKRTGIYYKHALSETGTPILEPLISLFPAEDNYPLGRYGKAIMAYMEETNSDRLDTLMLQGKLMKMLHQREDELKEMELTLFNQLMERNPRPKTDNILEVERHLNTLKMQAIEIVSEEIYQGI